MKTFFKETPKKLNLSDKYIFPPTSVLDTRQLKWQQRKRKWLALGIKSELGRDTRKDKSGSGNLNTDKYKRMGTYNTLGINQTTSIFDPVLCELMYTWFCPKNGNVLDPFAGGSVRGIMAQFLGCTYTGIDLNQKQIKENKKQANSIFRKHSINWINADSEKKLLQIKHKFDFIFSCPPYMDLEKYTDDKEDLSNMTDTQFIEKYNKIIKNSVSLLKTGGYACFVIGDLRDKKSGAYKDFITITKEAFKQTGMVLWNEIILINPLGTKAMTLEKGFINSKKLGKQHQNIYIFKKL